MADVSYTPEDLLRLTLATWIFRLSQAGVAPEDGPMGDLCTGVACAEDAKTGDELGWALVARVGELLGDADGKPDAMRALATTLYGDRVSFDLGGGTRDARTTRIRRYQFGRALPWLARIWERSPEGSVGPVWLLVEQVTDQVIAMDPNPWNDIDEERRLPFEDFQVLWELDACSSLHIR